MTNPITNAVQRRLFLRQSAYGLGTMALSQLLAGDQQLATASDRTDPLRPKLPHYTPKAKNVIFLNMAGGPSQFDLFTPKPQLQRLHGQPVPESFLSGLLLSLIHI